MTQRGLPLIRVLVTGGPTRAYLDRVRFLTNFSTGELAFALCEALCRRGVKVALVSGPCAPDFGKLPLAKWVPVETTEEMHAAVMGLCREFRPDFGVFTAAVLDFAPVKTRAGKVSSKTKRWNIALAPTPKIIDDVGKRYPKVRRVGFKLEWKGRKGGEAAMAKGIIDEKGLEALCLNFLSQIKGKKHPAWLVTKDGRIARKFTKREIAEWISDYITRFLSNRLPA